MNVNRISNCINVMSFYTKWPRVSDGSVLGERWWERVAGRAGSGRRGAEMSRFSAEPGEDGRSEDAVVRGPPTPASLEPRAPPRPAPPRPAPRADVTLPCPPPALVCAAPRSDRANTHAAPCTTSVLITWRFPFLRSGLSLKSEWGAWRGCSYAYVRP